MNENEFLLSHACPSSSSPPCSLDLLFSTITVAFSSHHPPSLCDCSNLWLDSYLMAYLIYFHHHPLIFLPSFKHLDRYMVVLFFIVIPNSYRIFLPELRRPYGWLSPSIVCHPCSQWKIIAALLCKKYMHKRLSQLAPLNLGSYMVGCHYLYVMPSVCQVKIITSLILDISAHKIFSTHMTFPVNPSCWMC